MLHCDSEQRLHDSDIGAALQQVGPPSQGPRDTQAFPSLEPEAFPSLEPDNIVVQRKENDEPDDTGEPN
jgi:hypothetical protein